MKVSELIEFLNDHDGEADVYIRQDAEDLERLAVLAEVRYCHGENDSVEVVLS